MLSVLLLNRNILVVRHPGALVSIALPSRWIREYQEDGGNAFRGNGNLRPEQEELRQLREEVKRLKMEKEILKKAAVFFAKETK